jgi:tetratricopeptide (TPR) repeat protein
MALFFYQLQGEQDPEAYEHAYRIYAGLEREGKLRPAGRIEMARCLLALAARAAEEGRFDRALELCARADPILGDEALASFERFSVRGDVRQQASILHDLMGDRIEHERSLRAAAEAYAKAEEHAVGSRQSVWEQARLARRHGRVLEALGDDLGALRRYRRALLVLDAQEFPDRRWLEAKVRALE